MNRKQKIIISITGIVLVSLILIGLTYAYFLTKITGNTNDKSISVTTANLILEYGENTSTVQGISNAEPGYSVEKIFTATNKGNSSVTYGAALEDIVNGLSRQQDLVYTLTCTSYLKEGFSLSSNGTITGTVDGECSGVSTETKFPSTSTLSIMTTNTIDTTHTHAYKLTVTYKEMNVDQSDDMNKTFSAKVNIVDLAKLTVDNPYKNDTGTLKKAIIDNAMLGLNETIYQETPKTKPAEEASTEKEKELSITSDDYGTSYYYRGNVLNNYVNFAGMCWRIVRIQGDGSIKLILEDQDNTCTTSSANWNIPTTTDGTIKKGKYGSTSKYFIASDGTKNQFSVEVADYLNNSGTNTMVYAFKNFQTGPLANYLNKLKSGDWCLNDKAYASSTDNSTELTQIQLNDYRAKLTEFYYDSYVRLYGKSVKEPTLKCNGTNMTKFNDDSEMYVGTLTLDDVVFAGDIVESDHSKSYYLFDGFSEGYSANKFEQYFWLLSLSKFQTNGVSGYDRVYMIGDYINEDGTSYYENNFRPSVHLKNNIIVSSGNGTKENPYVVE